MSEKEINPFTDIPYVEPETISVPKSANIISGAVAGQSVTPSGSQAGAKAGSERIGTNTVGGNEFFYVGDPISAIILLGQLRTRTAVGEYGIWIGTTGQFLKYSPGTGLKIVGGGIEAGTIDIPNKTVANSAHIDVNGNIWTGCNSADFLANPENAVAYLLSDGTFKCIKGKFGGWNVDATRIYSDGLNFDSENERIYSTNYVSGTFGQGFSLSKDLLEVGNISARGMIRTANFQKNVISSIAGGQVISPDSSTLSVDMTAVATTITIKSESSFDIGDTLRMKEGIQDEWMIVTKVVGSGVYNVIRNAGARIVIDNCDSLTNWGPGGVNMTNIVIDTTEYKEGTGCIKFDTTTGVGNEATILRSNLGDLDVSSLFNPGYIIARVYLADVSWITSLEIHISSGAVWPNDRKHKTITTDINGDAFSDGWNIIKFDTSSMSSDGTYNPALTKFLRYDINGTTEADAGWRMDDFAIYPATTTNVWTKGATVVNYGRNGQGLIYQTASESNSPYQDMFTHTGTPWAGSTNTTKVRVGNLSGISDSDFGGALSGYGIYTQNGYFKGTVDVGTKGAVKGGQTAYAIGDGFFLGYESGVYKQSIGNATNYLKYDGTNMYFSGAMILNAPLSLPSYTVANLPIPPSSAGPQSASSNAY